MTSEPMFDIGDTLRDRGWGGEIRWRVAQRFRDLDADNIGERFVYVVVSEDFGEELMTEIDVEARFTDMGGSDD